MTADHSPSPETTQFQIFVEASSIPTAVSRPDGQIFLANAPFAQVFGLPLEKVIGSYVVDYYDDPEDLKAVVAALNQHGRLQDLEIRARRADGTVVWTQVSVASVVLAGETCTLIAFSDVTRRIKAETALLQRTRLLEALNDLAREVASTLDLAPILHTAVASITDLLDVTSTYLNTWDEKAKTLTVIAEYYGPAASAEERISDFGVAYHIVHDFGVAEEWLYDSTNYHISHVDDADLADPERAHLQTFGAQTTLEVPLRAQDKPLGTLELWESRCKREFTPEEIELVQAIAFQVALAIQNARLYEQAREVSRLKSEFLGKISHELRTPLGVILGYAEMLHEGLYGEMSGSQSEAVTRILETTAVLTDQVNNLLDAARLEAGKLDLNQAPFRLPDLLDRLQNFVEPQARAKGLLFSVETTAVPDTLIGDAQRIEQMLVHLLRNALKYTADGRITLHISQPQANIFAFTVTDTGPGIPPEAQAAIFDSFRQVDDTITRQFSGAGLGLAIVRLLARLMGGEIYLESTVGQGSSFSVVLPLDIPKALPTHEAPP